MKRGNNYKHGMSRTKIYHTWSRMKTRCFNENSTSYQYYGGRGITVCDRWKDSFENFYEDMGDKPNGTSLDRINNDGNYTPENCRWATKEQQIRNRRNSLIIEFNGKKQHIKEWEKLSPVSARIIAQRLRKDWDVPSAILVPNRSTKF